ncbi:hypothetical protein [Flavobacterium sp. PS2]|uniref:hypothetical protein n=1 Tax=Flavobacterium sp. PS2 TaxID=3384157 RepID=UPI00390C6EAA
MPLYKLTEEDKKGYAKKYLENLEYWLRRIIDQKFTEKFGNDYINYETAGQFLIRKEIREKVETRFNKYSERFQRKIDATLLEHLIEIICKENLYNEIFKPFFEQNFKLGRIQLKNNLTELSDIRNRVNHVNPISVRQLEKSICYTNDIIESIKEHYKTLNMDKKFNVPTFLSYSDSFGQHFLREHINWATNCLVLNNRKFDIYCYDKISLEVEIDPSFSSAEYDVIWNIGKREIINEKNIEITFNESDVADFYSVIVKVVSKKSWHKLNNCDDCLAIQFTILPPR